MDTYTKITLELNSADTQQNIIEAHKGDIKSRYIIVSLSSNGVLVSLNSNIEAYFDAVMNDIILADGQKAEVNLEDNTIKIELLESMLTLSGIVRIDLKIKEGTSLITAQTFKVRIAKSVITKDSKYSKASQSIKDMIDLKADKETSEELKNKINNLKEIFDETKNYPTIHYLKSYYYTFSEMDNALQKKSDIDNVYTKKQTDSLIQKKADKSDTLQGYGITDAYTKLETDERFITNTESSINTGNISNKAITSDKLANSSVTALKLVNNSVGTNAIADNSISSLKLMSNSVTSNSITNDCVTLSKLNSNVYESGDGVLNDYGSIQDKVKSATYEYVRVGNYCICNLKVIIAENFVTSSYLQFTTLPYKNIGSAQYNFANSTKGVSSRFAISGVSTWSNIYRGVNGSYSEDEIITTTVVYKIV